MIEWPIHTGLRGRASRLGGRRLFGKTAPRARHSERRADGRLQAGLFPSIPTRLLILAPGFTRPSSAPAHLHTHDRAGIPSRQRSATTQLLMRTRIGLWQVRARAPLAQTLLQWYLQRVVVSRMGRCSQTRRQLWIWLPARRMLTTHWVIFANKSSPLKLIKINRFTSPQVKFLHSSLSLSFFSPFLSHWQSPFLIQTTILLNQIFWVFLPVIRTILVCSHMLTGIHENNLN